MYQNLSKHAHESFFGAAERCIADIEAVDIPDEFDGCSVFRTYMDM